ncbi:MAG TPA: CBS domain-containing protein [Acidobacteriaceae bacterium]|nr:CBS domain-containing protein [Acidobacteriaceae bacterium]
MRGWSFPLGRWTGVELRIHTFFLLLLGVCLAYTESTHLSIARGIGLWLVLVIAVAVRELARVIVAAYSGLRLRNILLLPIGGLMSYANAESAERAADSKVQWRMALTGPAANLSFALVVALLVAGMAPAVNLLERPWITPAHLIRSIVWMNIFLGILNVLPAYPLDGGRVVRGGFTKARGNAQGTRVSAGLGQILAMVSIVAGVVTMNMWLLMAGFFILIGAQLEDQGVLFQNVVDTVHMADVMLTEFSMLAPSDTLEDALYKAIHTLQDDFPVVRGNSLVGIISRQSILDALRSEGNGYVQAVMSRSFHVAQPEDSLGTTISRFGGRGLSMVPVTQGDRIVGIVTLQNLMHSMGLLSESRRLRQQSQE